MPQLKQETVDFYFAPQPLTLRSPADKRGHTSDRVPLVQTDNPFAIAPNKASIISNPSNTLVPLWDGALSILLLLFRPASIAFEQTLESVLSRGPV